MRGRGSTIAGVLAALTLLAGVIGVGVRSGDDGVYPVTAFFPRAIGLFPRSTVRVLGVEVGRVASVTPEGDRVRAVLHVRDGIRIPVDARAIIVPISLISDRYVQLEPVWRAGQPFLEPGDAIPLDRGVAPAELDDLLATLESFLEAIEPGTADEPGALGALVQNASRALDGRGPELGTTISNLSTLLDVLGRNAGTLDSLIVRLDDVVRALSRRDSALVAMNRGLAQVFSALAEERQALGSGVSNLADLIDELGRLVAAHRSDLETDLQILSDTTDAVVAESEHVVRQLLWLPVLSRGARQAFDQDNDRIYVRDNQQVREQ